MTDSTLGTSVYRTYHDTCTYANMTQGLFYNAKKRNPCDAKRTFFNHHFIGECLRCMIDETRKE